MDMKRVIDEAIATHQQWADTFRAEIAAQALTERTRNASYDDLCEFGKWLYGLDDGQNLHHDFHSIAGELVALILMKQYPMAERLIEGEYAEVSERLQQALREWREHLEL